MQTPTAQDHKNDFLKYQIDQLHSYLSVVNEHAHQAMKFERMDVVLKCRKHVIQIVDKMTYLKSQIV